MTIGVGIGRIQQLHGAKVDLTAFQSQAHPIVQGEISVQHLEASFMDKGIDLVILLSENLGVIGISGNTL
jgi:hypothetical protein